MTLLSIHSNNGGVVSYPIQRHMYHPRRYFTFFLLAFFWNLWNPLQNLFWWGPFGR